MQIFTVLLSMIPSAVQAAQNGQAAWRAWQEARKVQGDDDLNAHLDLLASDFIRLRVLAEYEANN